MTQSNIDWFEQFLNSLLLGGWGNIFAPHGWDLSIGSSQDTLSIDRSRPGVEEFSLLGASAVHPGDPSLSLLYHMLMHPAVNTNSISFWPSLGDIDSLENHIYGLVPPSENQLISLVPVVMAYEYRVTARTPHKKHADLVFSRTGVGRVGTHEPKYSPQRRCFNTDPEDGTGGTRVQPARYGLFLCHQRLYGDRIEILGRKHSEDGQRFFYEPVCKLYDGMMLGEETVALTFDHFHQNDKLYRMVKAGNLKLGVDADINQPPFTYKSGRENIVAFRSFSGSVVVSRLPQELCRIAKQNETVITFNVPKESLVWFKKLLSKFKISFFYNNRRYTSLRVGQNSLWAAVDFGLNTLISALGSDKRVFLSPRRAGEFTNIRHILNKEGRVVDLNLLPIGKFKETLSEGGYQAVMYEDPIAEGYVTARIDGISFPLEAVYPAYSLMTAPDFMPKVGNIDIYQYESNFVTGGPRALCEGRLPVNLRLKYDNSSQLSGSTVFSKSEQTVTSVVSKARTQMGVCRSSTDYNNTHFLSDEASDIFAPGWDVTYTRESFFSSPYYHTSGLGSPFLEDVKLCAAANGMWPAASPDAARTFKRKTRTALPLTDEEIGLSPQSFLGGKNRQGVYGWDGEYGPYLDVRNGKYIVNYAAIERSDYINNYFEERFDFSKVRGINRPEAKKRLASLAQVNKILLGGSPLDKSDNWLVSFSKVENFSDTTRYLNIPTIPIERSRFREFLKSTVGSGYFYVFVKYSAESYATKNPIRRMQPVDELVFVISQLDLPPEVFVYRN